MMGPYDTEREAAAGPMPLEVDRLRAIASWDDRRNAVRGAKTYALAEACRDCGVELGLFDARILDWLAEWEPASVQVVIGLIRRAHAAGKASG